MKFLSCLLLALTSATAVLAQDSYAEGLLAALRSANLTQLADIVGNNTGLVSEIQSGNKTVLAPTNDAFSALGDSAPTGNDLLNVIRYHIVNSTLAQDDDNEAENQDDSDSEFDVIIRSTLLTDNVSLPGNRSQVIVVGEYDGDNSNETYYVQLPGRNVSFASENDGPQYQNLRVQPITQVLTPPGDLATVIGQLELTQLSTLLGNANLVDALSGAEGLTIFAPQNSALESAQDAFGAASSEEQTNVLRNHVLMNRVIYSTQLPEDDDDDDDNNDRITNVTSASGNTLTFNKNETGLYVSSGEATARIIRSDNIYNAGVIHVIDGVLLNTTANQQAADDAAGAQPTGSTGVDSDVDANGTNNSNNNNNNNSNDDSSSSNLVWSSAAAAIAFMGGLALLV